MIFFLLYNVLLVVLFPIILLMLYWPKTGKMGFGSRWIEHFGWIKKSEQAYDIWLHAVSVGECNAAIPMIKKLQASQPTLNILITTTTASGFKRIESQLGDSITHHYYPVFYPASGYF